VIERVRSEEGKIGYRIRPSLVVPMDDPDECVTEEVEDDEVTEENDEIESIPTFDMGDSTSANQFPLVNDTILFSAVEGLREESVGSEKLAIDTSLYYGHKDHYYSLPTPVTPPYTMDSPPSATDVDLLSDSQVDRYLDISDENSYETTREEYPAQVIARFAYLDPDTLFLVSTICETVNPMYVSVVDDVEFYITWIDNKLPIIRLVSNKMINATMLLSICGVKEKEEEMILSSERGIVYKIADDSLLDGSYIPLKRALEFARTFGCLDSLRVFLSERVGELFEDRSREEVQTQEEMDVGCVFKKRRVCGARRSDKRARTLE
jgi:hypothetical protein